MAEDIWNELLLNGPEAKIDRFLDLSITRSKSDRKLFDFSAASPVPKEFTEDLLGHYERFYSIHGATDRDDFWLWRDEQWGSSSIFGELHWVERPIKGVARVGFVTQSSGASLWPAHFSKAFPELSFEFSFEGSSDDGDNHWYVVRRNGKGNTKTYLGFAAYTKGLDSSPSSENWQKMDRAARSISGYDIEWNWFYSYLDDLDGEVREFALEMDQFAEVPAKEIEGKVDHGELEEMMVPIRKLLVQDVRVLRKEFGRAKPMVIRRGQRRETSHLLGWTGDGNRADSDIGDALTRLSNSVLSHGGISR